jgi:hypothetical protein
LHAINVVWMAAKATVQFGEVLRLRDPLPVHLDSMPLHYKDNSSAAPARLLTLMAA